MRFLVDAQLPLALAHCLAAAGHEAEHVAEAGLAATRPFGTMPCAPAASSSRKTPILRAGHFSARAVRESSGLDCGTHVSANCSFGSKQCFRESPKHWSRASHRDCMNPLFTYAGPSAPLVLARRLCGGRSHETIQRKDTRLGERRLDPFDLPRGWYFDIQRWPQRPK
jgi:hypothetical protein